MGSPGLNCGIVWPFFRDQFSNGFPARTEKGYSLRKRSNRMSKLPPRHRLRCSMIGGRSKIAGALGDPDSIKTIRDRIELRRLLIRRKVVK